MMYHLFFILGNIGNLWKLAKVPLSSGSYPIVFEGIRGSSYYGDIALDDIKVYPGACP